ncbi:hypothetical protein [Photobacterium indicum]|nr:hypothetical protein [Photobacterium indicum]
MTLKLNTNTEGELMVEVRAWLCRERDNETDKPLEDWDTPITFTLK